eukprot:2424152-Pyramimonas_sp.AAC.1
MLEWRISECDPTSHVLSTRPGTSERDEGAAIELAESGTTVATPPRVSPQASVSNEPKTVTSGAIRRKKKRNSSND